MAPRGPVRLTVNFGPSRSDLFARVVRYAERWASELLELEPGVWRATFLLEASDPTRFARAERLVNYVSGWKASELEVDGEPEIGWVVLAMLTCAYGYLKLHGRCGHTYREAVPVRCRCCPLFDRQSAQEQMERWRSQIGGDPAWDPLPHVGSLGDIPDHVPDEWTEGDGPSAG
jgi:hypothetical protein